MFELAPKVGRVLNDKMPTGVAVSAAMNHGGPYPATGHPGFTAVGVPGVAASLRQADQLRQRPTRIDCQRSCKTRIQLEKHGDWSMGLGRRGIFRSVVNLCASPPFGDGRYRR